MIPFSVKLRNLKEKAKHVRDRDVIPGVVYGGKKNYSVEVGLKEFKHILHEAGRSNILKLNIEGTEVLSLIKDFQLHPLSSEFIHFDLLEVSEKKPLKIQVPINFVGTPKGIKEGGLLETLKDFIEVLCTVKNIPAQIDIDIKDLAVGESIHLKDLTAPKNTSFTQDTSMVIAVITEQEKTADEEPAPAE